MSIATSSLLGRTLATAIAKVRQTVGDPVAPVVVLTPSEANGILARQQLALAGDFMRVELMTPERLVHELGGRSLAARGIRSQRIANQVNARGEHELTAPALLGAVGAHRRGTSIIAEVVYQLQRCSE